MTPLHESLQHLLAVRSARVRGVRDVWGVQEVHHARRAWYVATNEMGSAPERKHAKGMFGTCQVVSMPLFRSADGVTLATAGLTSCPSAMSLARSIAPHSNARRNL